MYKLDDDKSLQDYIECLNDGSLQITKQISNIIDGKINGDDIKFEALLKTPCSINDVINGKDKTERIVNIDIKDDTAYLFIDKDDKIITEKRTFKQWALSNVKNNASFYKLNGNSYYNYRKYYNTEDFKNTKGKLYQNNCYFQANHKESFMIDSGVTCYKNITPKEISILSFDLETNGFDGSKSTSKVLCIGNTYRNKQTIEKRLFREDHYVSQEAMIKDWALWVKQKDPSILTGYNIYLFDIPYLLDIADTNNFNISIGRDDSNLQFEDRRKPRTIRKDGSQEYDYRRPEVWGRDVIDMWIVALKADQASKKYDSYALKHIVKVEGLEKEGRVHYDASKIAEDWKDLSKREDICNYCIDDSEDPIKLFDLMATPFFLLTVHIPKTFQLITESNTGGQINSLMVRSYLQEAWAIPKGIETNEFQGAISFGIPGLYKNALKLDVSSLYPSIMRQYDIKPKSDYMGNFLKTLEYFTLERLKNKKLAKVTGNKYYDELQGLNKIFINSAYGFLTTPGLNFNDMDAGSSVTRYGRDVLNKALLWASGKDSDHWMNLNKEKADE